MLASLTTAIAQHGFAAVFALMAVDALLPVGGELVMLYAGVLAAGDLVAEHFTLGYGVSIALFGAMIAAVAFMHYVLAVNPVLTFWLAYIMTRPLGASIGDEMSQNSHRYGGLGLGTTGTSYIFLACILALVVYLSITRRDQTPPERALPESAPA